MFEIHLKVVKTLVLESHLRDTSCLQMYAQVATNHMYDFEKILNNSSGFILYFFLNSYISRKFLSKYLWKKGPVRDSHTNTTTTRQSLNISRALKLKIEFKLAPLYVTLTSAQQYFGSLWKCQEHWSENFQSSPEMVHCAREAWTRATMTKALCQGRIGKLDWVAALVGDPPDANSTADTDTHLLSHIGDNLSTPPIIGDQCCHMKRRNESVYQ